MRYNKEENKWDRIGSLPDGVFSMNGWGIAFVACGDQLMVIGRSRHSRGEAVELHSWIPDEDPLQWNVLTRMQSGSFVHNCAVMGCGGGCTSFDPVITGGGASLEEDGSDDSENMLEGPSYLVSRELPCSCEQESWKMENNSHLAAKSCKISDASEGEEAPADSNELPLVQAELSDDQNHAGDYSDFIHSSTNWVGISQSTVSYAAQGSNLQALCITARLWGAEVSSPADNLYAVWRVLLE
ncbi:hypothetical protein FEM48_Zijuj05G0151200 [Ziziphus jujuba var. spinosa]|uniref:Uncharacterized protein n=1 Tax=Ziziphus jujuba var. spinosa TaxID=714518 RepID=A0A978VFI7_ZIZJJ|nr:hypothetical protein FEM48_Zijuj05G0151200 [Ziziphus jujuba var. spinosa]